MISAATAGLFADAILALHVAIVAFVVLGEVLILAGGRRGWRWVRNFVLRAVHVGLMVVIALQAWIGALCPLTVWERDLRRRAGEAVYEESFIEHWLSQVLYFELPWWAFVVAYSAFAVLVLLTWRRVPPRPFRSR